MEWSIMERTAEDTESGPWRTSGADCGGYQERTVEDTRSGLWRIPGADCGGHQERTVEDTGSGPRRIPGADSGGYRERTAAGETRSGVLRRTPGAAYCGGHQERRVEEDPGADCGGAAGDTRSWEQLPSWDKRNSTAGRFCVFPSQQTKKEDRESFICGYCVERQTTEQGIAGTSLGCYLMCWVGCVLMFVHG